MARDDEVINTGLTIEEVRQRYPARRKKPDDPSPLITSRLIISGDGLVGEEYTKATGVEPSRVIEKPPVTGRSMPSGSEFRPRPRWIRELDSQPLYEIETGLITLLDLLWPQREAIKRLVAGRGHQISFATIVVIYEDRPLYCLSTETMRRLAELGARWVLDIADYR